MSNKERPELSKKNKYWIEKHRYYELKHYCLQYPIWVKAYRSLDGLSKRPEDLALFNKTKSNGDPTALCAEAREFYASRIAQIEKVAMSTDLELYSFILAGVTEGFSYESMKAKWNIPCSQGTYYDRYRRFFWLLNKARE